MLYLRKEHTRRQNNKVNKLKKKKLYVQVLKMSGIEVSLLGGEVKVEDTIRWGLLELYKMFPAELDQGLRFEMW